MLKKVTAKLGGMRKPQEFCVLPMKREGEETTTLMIQSDKSIGILDFRTGKGKLNTKGCYTPHLMLAQPFDFPPEFVQACLEACPSLGGTTEIAPGIIMQHTVQVF